MSIEQELRRIRVAIEKLDAKMGQAGGRPSAYSVRDAARETGLGLTTIKKLIREQTILTVVVGRRRLVPHSEIEKFLRPNPSPVRVPKTRRKTEAEKLRSAPKR